MSNVQQAIEKAASHFAHEIVAILRRATLQEILEITGNASVGDNLAAVLSPTRGGRGSRRVATGRTAVDAPLPRGRARDLRGTGHKRTPGEVDALAERALAHLAAVKSDQAVSAIAAALKVPVTALALPMQRLRKEGKVRSTGLKRSMVYRIA